MNFNSNDLKDIIKKIISVIVANKILALIGSISILTFFLRSKIKILYEFLIETEFNLFWIIIFFLFLILICFIINLIKKRLKDKKTIDDYNRDYVLGILWIWKNYYRQIRDLNPICPLDFMDLEYQEGHAIETSEHKGQNYKRMPFEDQATFFFCQKCGFKKEVHGNYIKIADYVKKEIIRKSRTGDWKEVFKKK